jgi:hypothetical protein
MKVKIGKIYKEMIKDGIPSELFYKCRRVVEILGFRDTMTRVHVRWTSADGIIIDAEYPTSIMESTLNDWPWKECDEVDIAKLLLIQGSGRHISVLNECRTWENL